VSTCRKFVDDTKLGGAANIQQGHATIQRNLDRLEKWVKGQRVQQGATKMAGSICHEIRV